MFKRAGTDFKKDIMITNMKRMANILRKPHNKIYYDYKFEISNFDDILFIILKKDSKIIWDKEIMLSSKDPLQNKCWLSFNEYKFDTKDWKKLDEWNFNYYKNNVKRLQKLSARLFKSIKKGVTIIITKKENYLHIEHYTWKYLIVREDSSDVMTAEFSTEELKILASATEMYLLTWNKNVLKHYVKSMYDSGSKIKKVICKEIEGLEAYIFFGLFLNILSSPTISIVRLHNNLRDKDKSNRLKLSIRASEAIVNLSPDSNVKLRIRFSSMEICYDDLNVSKLEWHRAIFENPRIVSIEHPQLCYENDKKDQLFIQIFLPSLP